jgi:D-arabinose 1-dehydrogenase-like Zn-dependent alcohol dehydrogenase
VPVWLKRQAYTENGITQYKLLFTLVSQPKCSSVRSEKAAIQSHQGSATRFRHPLANRNLGPVVDVSKGRIWLKVRAIVAEEFGGYRNLKPADILKPAMSDGRVLVRMTAAGVTPLDHTILSGNLPMAKAPLVLGNEGAGIVEGSGEDQFPDGCRVMFTGPYGVFENGAFSEWVAVEKEHLCLIPENIGDAAAGLPVAYLTAFMALRAAGFQPGKTVLAPARPSM